MAPICGVKQEPKLERISTYLVKMKTGISPLKEKLGKWSKYHNDQQENKQKFHNVVFTHLFDVRDKVHNTTTATKSYSQRFNDIEVTSTTRLSYPANRSLTNLRRVAVP